MFLYLDGYGRLNGGLQRHPSSDPRAGGFLGLGDGILYGRGALQMRSFWIGAPYKRWAEGGVKTEEKWMRSWEKGRKAVGGRAVSCGCGQSPEAGKCRETDSAPGLLEGARPCQHLDLWSSEAILDFWLPVCERINMRRFSRQVCVICDSRSRKWIHWHGGLGLCAFSRMSKPPLAKLRKQNNGRWLPRAGEAAREMSRWSPEHPWGSEIPCMMPRGQATSL